MGTKMIKKSVSKEEFSWEIDPTKGPDHYRHAIYAYSPPDCSLYVNGVWITKEEMLAMIKAMKRAVAFVNGDLTKHQKRGRPTETAGGEK